MPFTRMRIRATLSTVVAVLAAVAFDARGSLGDVNGDGAFNQLDVPAFVAVVLGQDANPTHAAACDFDSSGAADAEDIPGFVSAVLAAADGTIYDAWPDGPPADVNFFHVGVWLQSTFRAAIYRDMGINTYVALFNPLDQQQISELNAAGMRLIVEQSSFALSSPLNHVITGWTQQDEPDNAQPLPGGGYGPCIPPQTLVNEYNAIRAANATRPVFLNFGRGVSDINWGGRGPCTGDTSYYPIAAAAGDILSFDIYPVVTYNGRLEYVAEGVQNLVNWSGGDKIIYNFIETTHIENPNRRPTVGEIKAEVWMSLIHGSMGVTYFVHEWEPSFAEAGILRYPEIVAGVTAINAQIHALAPVLNSPTVVNGAQVSASIPVATMVKRWGGATYVFAVAMRNTATSATFTVPSAPASGSVEVIGEARSLPLAGQQFQDSFGAYGVHLYRVTSN